MTLSELNKYGPAFQVKVIHSLLERKEFLTNIYDILDSSYFDNQAHKWIIDNILKYYHEYHTTPTPEVLKSEYEKVTNDVLKVSIREQLRDAYKTVATDSEYIESEFASFCKNQQLKKALLNSVDLLKAEDYDSIRGLIDNALKAGMDKNIGHEYLKDIETRYRQEQRITIPTPWKEFNDILQGGLGNGDFGLIFGGPGAGKSWGLVALAGHAVKLGYNVVYYTLELGEDYVGRRFDAYFTQIPANEVMYHKDVIQETMDKLPGNLIIKEFAPGKAGISSVESHITKCGDLGTKPDLVVIDYVDLLRSNKTNRERKDEIDDIYTSTKGLARELDIPIWSASQVNRQGAQDDIIEGHKAAGSYDKMMITDFCASISRKAKDKQTGVGRFHIMKNRYGMDGLTFGTLINIAIGKFEMVSDEEFSSLSHQEEIPDSKLPTDNFSLAEKNQLQMNASLLQNL
jgi:replicative DNA helicase|tara:strand:+ start:431 stop:1804 length:1374 start_codon:yes stop_codon:yes gene_type:complete